MRSLLLIEFPFFLVDFLLNYMANTINLFIIVFYLKFWLSVPCTLLHPHLWLLLSMELLSSLATVRLHIILQKNQSHFNMPCTSYIFVTLFLTIKFSKLFPCVLEKPYISHTYCTWLTLQYFFYTVKLCFSLRGIVYSFHWSRRCIHHKLLKTRNTFIFILKTVTFHFIILIVIYKFPKYCHFATYCTVPQYLLSCLFY